MPRAHPRTPSHTIAQKRFHHKFREQSGYCILFMKQNYFAIKFTHKKKWYKKNGVLCTVDGTMYSSLNGILNIYFSTSWIQQYRNEKNVPICAAATLKDYYLRKHVPHMFYDDKKWNSLNLFILFAIIWQQMINFYWFSFVVCLLFSNFAVSCCILFGRCAHILFDNMSNV